MLKSPVLRSPGVAGVFDPNSTSVGLPFDLADIGPDFLRPSTNRWRKTLQVFHELAHLYQFYTTSYGFIYNMWTRAQIFIMCAFISNYSKVSKRYSLPLLREGSHMSIKMELDESELFLRLIWMFEQYRRSVFGYEVYPEKVSELFSLSTEWDLGQEVLHSLFGFPKITIYHVPDDLAVSHADHYRIDDLLESHAHALSSIWMMQAVERYGLPHRITEELLDCANDRAVGPYGAFLRYAPGLPTEPKSNLSTFCVLCDIALNPPAINITNTNPNVKITIPDCVWSPVERIWSYLVRAVDGKFPVLPPKLSNYPECEFSYLTEVKKSLGLEGENVLPYKVDINHQLEPIIEAAKGLLDAEDTHKALTTVWLDIIGTFQLANEIRKTVPLVLGGAVIEELELLFGSIGSPNVSCKIRGTEKIYHRVCAGLSKLGVVPKKDLLVISDAATCIDISIVEAMRKLLLMNRSEATATAKKKPFGQASLSLAEVLSIYDLALDDFD